jgi:predicted transcriptional regulator
MDIDYVRAEATLLTKSEIFDLAEGIASDVGFSPGDDISDAVHEFGGTIEIQDTLLSDPQQTGSLFVESPNEFRIVVPAHTSPARDRFTIAHELGHFVLHYLWKYFPDKVDGVKLVAFRKDSDRVEWEANWFAAAFLMPKSKFIERYRTLNGDLRHISRFFRVSEAAARVRSIDLGLSNGS